MVIMVLMVIMVVMVLMVIIVIMVHVVVIWSEYCATGVGLSENLKSCLLRGPIHI